MLQLPTPDLNIWDRPIEAHEECRLEYITCFSLPFAASARESCAAREAHCLQ